MLKQVSSSAPIRASAVAAAVFWLAACESEKGAAAIEAPALEFPTDMAIGAPGAPVTVIEYASVTCPGCAHFHQEIFPSVKADYIDTGKVRFIYREFPTAPAQLSVAGSLMARCAAEKAGAEGYFATIGSLFSAQQVWVRAQSPRAELLKIAGQAGLDEAAFDACLKRQDLLDVINANTASGRERYGVNSTPSFIIDGEVRQFRSAEEMTAALDKALENAAE